MTKNNYYTTQEVADIVGFSSDHIRRLVRQGKLRALRRGWCYLIHHKDLATIKRRRFDKPKDKES